MAVFFTPKEVEPLLARDICSGPVLPILLMQSNWVRRCRPPSKWRSAAHSDETGIAEVALARMPALLSALCWRSGHCLPPLVASPRLCRERTRPGLELQRLHRLCLWSLPPCCAWPSSPLFSFLSFGFFDEALPPVPERWKCQAPGKRQKLREFQVEAGKFPTLLRLAKDCWSMSSNLFSTSFFLSSYLISFRRSL